MGTRSSVAFLKFYFILKTLLDSGSIPRSAGLPTMTEHGVAGHFNVKEIVECKQ